nr:4-(cytidine 5'-diphospho)-2-C-methyl-D-erythritol kinase [Thiorhodospira sibirica]
MQGWPAPAKLNLFLHITGRRADGYHLLQSVFQFLDYGDTLDFALRDDGQVLRAQALADVPPQQDLTVRAALALKHATAYPGGVEISVHKRLPMGGGLGGGSSDAATTLRVLNRLWGLDLTLDELAALGLSLGADVPVFVHGIAAWAEGVGEHLQVVDIAEPVYLVVNPGVSVATGIIFNDPQLTRDCKPVKICDFISGAVTNVCEPVVRMRYPEIAQALDWLMEKAGNARLTGTGGCAFAHFADAAQAHDIAKQLPSAWQGFVAKGCNCSPLHTRLSAY